MTTHDHLIKTITDIENAVLAQIDHNDTLTADDRLSIAVLLDAAASKQLAHAERIEQQAA